MPSIVHFEGFDHQADLDRVQSGGGAAADVLLDRKLIDQTQGLTAGTGPLAIPAGVPSHENWMYYAWKYGHLDQAGAGCAFVTGPQANNQKHAETYAGRAFYWQDSLGGAAGGADFNPRDNGAGRCYDWNGNLAPTTEEPVTAGGRWTDEVLDSLDGSDSRLNHPTLVCCDVLGTRGADFTWPGHDVINAWNPGGPNTTTAFNAAIKHAKPGGGTSGASTQYVEDCVVAWANLMKNIPRSIMMRMWHEQGNGVYSDAGNNWSLFNANWIKIINYWRSLGALTLDGGLDGKVLIAWVPASHGSNPSDNSESFPGTSFVDIIGLDLYIHQAWGPRDAAQLWYDAFHPDMGDGLGPGPYNPDNRPLVAFEGGTDTTGPPRDPACLTKMTELFDRLESTYPDNGAPTTIAGSGGTTVPNPAHDGPWPGISAYLWWDATKQELTAADQATYSARVNEAYFKADIATVEPGGGGINGMGYSTSVVHHAHADSASLHVLNPTQSTNWTFNLTGQHPNCVVHLAFRFATLPNVETALLKCIDTTVGGIAHQILVAPTGAMRIQIAGGGGGTAHGTISTNVWYVFEGNFQASGTTHQITWKVYPAGTPGSPVVANVTDTRTGQTDSHFLSCVVGLGSSSVATAEYYLDDWVVSETSADYPLGEHFCKVYKPNGKGTHNEAAGQFRNFTGTLITNASPQNSHLDIDDIPSNTNNGIQQTNNDATAYLEYTFSSVSEVTAPNCTRLYGVFFPNLSATQDFKMRLNDAGTLSAASASDPSLTPGKKEFHANTYPLRPGGGAWTAGAFQAIRARIGYSAAKTPHLADLYLGGSFPLGSGGISLVGNTFGPTATVAGGSIAGAGTSPMTGAFIPSTSSAHGGTLQATQGPSVSVVVGTLTATLDGSVEVLLGVADGVTSFTPGTGWTEKFDFPQDVVGGSSTQTLFGAYRVCDAGDTGAALGTLNDSTHWAAVHLVLSPNPVFLEVSAPVSDIAIGGIAGDTYTVLGNAVGPASIAVTVNGTAVTLAANGDFSSVITLAIGANTVTVVATSGGQDVTIVRTIAVTDTSNGGGGGGGEDPNALSDDLDRLSDIIQESGLDPRP